MILTGNNNHKNKTIMEMVNGNDFVANYDYIKHIFTTLIRSCFP